MQIKWDSDTPLQWSHQQINPLMRTVGPVARADLLNVIKEWLPIEPSSPTSRCDAVGFRSLRVARQAHILS
jgi:hypothetical protein